jgi:hypothetical protein
MEYLKRKLTKTSSRDIKRLFFCGVSGSSSGSYLLAWQNKGKGKVSIDDMGFFEKINHVCGW